jgi:hypothetical protein
VWHDGQWGFANCLAVPYGFLAVRVLESRVGR